MVIFEAKYVYSGFVSGITYIYIYIFAVGDQGVLICFCQWLVHAAGIISDVIASAAQQCSS